ncbi:ABC transporter ATP-binding protein [Roseibium polysiphoniae]|uniref:Spermidine/putrescine import ATP-binding protein PotA n=1 Tax=Roseibium polysiphoniae TaxID=2571221 RepID=A0ABR9CGM6_9HYPH|nr:ABC transporter ATP-binding protein [Roseibium polysiphoniae]MBD8878137.1 ABC transporter ATP-binding protein [Roseibium polysiphoniae]
MAKKTLGPVRREFTPWEDTAAEPFIEFRNVTKRFGDFVAVDNLSLKIYEREFFALLGGSGCGKTTMMRMLAGFETPTSGQIFLDGQDLAGIPAFRRPSNMMFQSYALFPHMSVENNIAFGLKQDKLPKSEIDDRVAEMLRLTKLEQFAKRKPHQLSGGQRQRVALARSLAKRPKVLLLDEPLGALDRKLREETQFELMALQEDLKMTFLIVTHDQEEAMTVADRIAVMDQGQLVQVATPAEIYETPNSKFVANFIGDVNLIETKVVEASPSQTRLEAMMGGFLIETDQTTSARPGDTVWYAIRPEKVRVAKGKAEPGSVNAVNGPVWDIAYLGDVSIIHAKIGEGDFDTLKSTFANVTRVVEDPITWYDDVVLTFDRNAGVILDR